MRLSAIRTASQPAIRSARRASHVRVPIFAILIAIQALATNAGELAAAEEIGLIPWIFHPDQASANGGASVGTAGDVNGDGYSDLIAGAPTFSGAFPTEGRVYVFHGSATGLPPSPTWIMSGPQAGARFGSAVASAGDVNGDGFGDVIIGAAGFIAAAAGDGKIFVYHGSAAGLEMTPAWTLEASQTDMSLGNAVGNAGDVNGDGFDDVIIGAPLYDNGEHDEGRAFVYLGSAVGLSNTPAWTGESDQASAQFGASVGTAGDVNGDGFADAIVGAPNFDNGQTNEGRAFVYHGSASGLGVTAAWTSESNQASSAFGRSVAGAGDVNGDGYADVIVGANLYSNVLPSEGRAFVYHGSATGLLTTAAWSSGPNQSGAHWGLSVATAGDVNGDSYADVIIGAPGFSSIPPSAGGVFVYAGSAGGLQSFAFFAIGSNQSNSQFGTSAGTAGDVNGDGVSEIVVGAYQFDDGQTDEGRISVYTGESFGVSFSSSWTAEGSAMQMEFGRSVANAGDVNGDGYSDVIVGAPGYTNGQTREGRASVYLGSATGSSISPVWSVESNIVNEQLGWSVAGAGDVNGDGYSDVIVGTSDPTGAQERALVYLGSAGGLATSPAWTRTIGQASASFGTAVAGAGDVNGDGFADVLVGASRFDNGQVDEGRAFLYAGSPSGLSISPIWTAESNQAGSLFGWSVGLAGDVNGDGFSDILVGAPLFSNGQASEGRALVYLGSASGPASAPIWTGESNQSGSFYGGAVGTGGDINGDGFSDIAVGAQNYDTANPNAGRAYVYHSSAAGPAVQPSWTSDGNIVDGAYGTSLGTAGDVNGDGYSDLIIGAFGVFIDEASYGATVFLGTASGLDFQRWYGGQEMSGARYGASVATAGDVDGDGFADVIIGAPGFDNAQTDMGKAFIHGNWNDGLPRIARQAQVTDSAPIQTLGLTHAPALRLKTLGRTPAGRGRVSLQIEVEPAGVPFDGAGLVTGVEVQTGVPGAGGSTVPLSEIAGNLAAGTLYHWRLRVLTDSPFFPHSRWLWPADNAVTEADVRTIATTGADEFVSAPASAALIADPTPNPFTSHTEIAYVLPHAGHLELGIYDVTGRLVAPLSGGLQPAGRHVRRWDGRDALGAELPAGVYFAYLKAAGQRAAKKIVIIR
jgi:hypothetical protein